MLLFTVLRRLLYSGILVVAVLVLNFLLIHLAPGDPADVIAGEMGGATQEILDSIRKAYGLDQPLFVQLWVYLKNAATGDLGQSYYYNVPVLGLIISRTGATLLLVFTALGFAIVTGTFLGVVASHKPKVSSAILSLFSPLLVMQHQYSGPELC